MSRLHIHSWLQSWSCFYEPSETYCRICRWAAANCCAIKRHACVLGFHTVLRSLLMSFCWSKTTPIAAPIKSCCQNHMSNSFCCIMHSEAQWAESMAGLIYKDELLPPFIVAWDDFLPVENKQNMTFNLVNNLFKITLLCTNMNGVCNIEGESSRQVAWI